MCSGIGAPELAAPWVDWRFASEIEPLPRAVLQERFGYRLPEDHNQGEPILWGDMTEITSDLLRSKGIPLPDLLVAGTPCQAFSVAGLRKGTADARGNLTLKFVEIAHELVAARPDGKLAVIWENVPGVLSDEGNAFGCFLAGLVGAVDALQPPGNGSWPSEGMVQGPRARAAWAVLDAQWFGVAQRRRRVFVVIDFGNCIDPAAILLEPDRLRGDSPPRREEGQDSAAGAPAGFGSGREYPNEVAPTVRAGGNRTGGDRPYGMDVDTSDSLVPSMPVTHTLRGEGFDASEDGSGKGTPIVPVAGAICRDSFTGGASGRPEGAAAGHFVPVAFDCKGTEVQFTQDGSHPTLRSMGHNTSHQNAGGHAAVATPWAVRRLTPRECERLQGAPDDHTLIRHGKNRRRLEADELAYLRSTYPDLAEDEARRLAADGPRYKSIGNSMARPVMKWIIDRTKVSYDQNRNSN